MSELNRDEVYEVFKDTIEDAKRCAAQSCVDAAAKRDEWESFFYARMVRELESLQASFGWAINKKFEEKQQATNK